MSRKGRKGSGDLGTSWLKLFNLTIIRGVEWDWSKNYLWQTISKAHPNQLIVVCRNPAIINRLRITKALTKFLWITVGRLSFIVDKRTIRFAPHDLCCRRWISSGSKSLFHHSVIHLFAKAPFHWPLYSWCCATKPRPHLIWTPLGMLKWADPTQSGIFIKNDDQHALKRNYNRLVTTYLYKR